MLKLKSFCSIRKVPFVNKAASDGKFLKAKKKLNAKNGMKNIWFGIFFMQRKFHPIITSIHPLLIVKNYKIN